MNCKNCERPLRTDYSFCSNCGAKIIRNKLNFKNLWYDISERYFNVNNTFLKTFWHLFTKPEVVIQGYIEGIRKKYLNPISYLGIAITLSGFTIFLMKKKLKDINVDIFGLGLESNAGTDAVFNFTTDYQALLFILYIPMMAIAGWLAFEGKNYNFTERLVIFMYALAHYSVFVFIPSLILLFLFPHLYMQMSFVFLSLMYLYTAYVIKRISIQKGIDLIARIFLFFVLFTIQYLAISILIPVFLLISGQIDLEQMIPKK